MAFEPGWKIHARMRSRRRLPRLKKSLICGCKTSSESEAYARETQHACPGYGPRLPCGRNANRVVVAARWTAEAAENRTDQQRWANRSCAAGRRRDESRVVRIDLFCGRLLRKQECFVARHPLSGSG